MNLNIFHRHNPTEPDTEHIVTVLPQCDFCKQSIQVIYQAAHYEGKTDFGWAFMCKEHFIAYGKGLGCGKGQRLVLK